MRNCKREVGVCEEQVTGKFFQKSRERHLTVLGGDIILVRIVEKLNCYRSKIEK
jgi:hypothetical protein